MHFNNNNTTPMIALFTDDQSRLEVSVDKAGEPIVIVFSIEDMVDDVRGHLL